MNKPDKKETPRLIAENRKARYDYFIEERLEAGLVLQGWEVKSMRAGKAQIAEGYVYLKNGEAFLFGALITPLNTTSTHVIADPKRTRKLLLSKAQLSRLRRQRRAPGLHSGAAGPALEERAAPSSKSASPRARNSTTSAPPRRSATGIVTRPESSDAVEASRRDSMYARETSNGGDRFRRGLRTVRGVPRVYGPRKSLCKS